MRLSGGATIDGPYRYRLWRTWDENRPTVGFVMLNPSTADHRIDDPTIRRCIGFAVRDGFGSLEVVNLFALRATNPSELGGPVDPIGPKNDAAIRAFALQVDQVIAAWGTTVEKYPSRSRGRRRVAEVLEILRGGRVVEVVDCYGHTRAGHPRHPLYLPRQAPRCVLRT